MTSGPLGPGSNPWEEFFNRFFGGGGPAQPVHRVDLTRLMSGAARELVVDAARHAAATGSSDLDTSDLLWAALQHDQLRELLRRSGADPDTLDGQLAELERQERAGRPVPGTGMASGPGAGQGTDGAVSLTPATKRALLEAHQISRAVGSSYIGPEHILMALAANDESPAGELLGRSQPPARGFGAGMPFGRSGSGFGLGGSPFGPGGSSPGATGQFGPPGGSATPTLEQFGQDLTAQAREGRLDPVVGRGEEIEQTIEVLSRRTKNNPVLIGEAGVGKTAIVEGIAQRVAAADVPQTLAGKRVIQLDMVGMVAGTRYRGDFEERIKRVIDEIREHSDELVVFIDELHTVVGAGGTGGGEGSMDAGNILKPALARGELRVIGATTLDEYRRGIEKDAALARRFQPILVPEPSVTDTVEILRGLRDRYEAHHQVRFTDEALVAAAELSDRYIADRFLPDKAIDLVDQAGARVRLRTKTPAADLRDQQRRLEQLRRDKDQAVADERYERASALRDEMAQVQDRIEELGRAGDAGGGGAAVPVVGPEEIAEVVARATGIPVSQLTREERERLLRLEEHLHQRVVGQDEAVRVVAEAVRRSRSGLGDPDRPVGSFLFLGPTGVGKTELARALAEALFGDQDRMIRLDMSEFQERHTVARLVGAPPGYVGYDEAGQLTEAVRRRPYAVVLLDEIEKAHPDVFNTLLQVLDDGRLTDSQGRTVSFRNTVVIMTSNIGSDLIVGNRQRLGFDGGAGGDGARAMEGLRDQLMRRLAEQFRPEFLNRIDEIIIFERLETEQLRAITQLMLEQTRRRLRAQDIEVEFTPAAVDWLADRGYQPEFGARPMRRVIQREVDNRLSSMLLDGVLSPGQRVTADARDGRLHLDVRAPESTGAAIG